MINFLQDLFNVSTVEKDLKQQKENTLKAASSNGNAFISARLEKEINRLANGNHLSKKIYMANAIETTRLVNYALYVATTPGVPRLEFNDEEKELINAVSTYVGYGKIYSKSGTADLGLYDAAQRPIGYMGKYLLSLEDIDVIKNNAQFNLRMRETVATNKFNVDMATNIGNSPIILFDPISGIQIPNQKKPDDMPEITYVKFEANLQPLIHNPYYYDKDNEGNWRVNIVINSSFVHTVSLDDGSIMGGSQVSVLGSYKDPRTGWVNTVFVPVSKFQQIAATILSGTPAMYIIDDASAQEIFKQQFNNGLIYRFIDFSGTAFLDSIDNKPMFERRLNACLKIMDMGGMNMRFRFRQFITPMDFELIADSQCISTLQSIDATAPINFNTPVILKFSGNRITKEIGVNKQVIMVNFA